MNMMIKLFKNMKYRQKLIISYIIISILPVIILGIFSYTQSRNNIMNEAKQNIKNNISQTAANIDFKIKRCSITIDSILTNTILLDVVQNPFDGYFDMYLAYKQTLDPVINSLLFINDDIERLTFYLEDAGFNRGKLLRSNSEIMNESWYDDLDNSMGNNWFIQDGKMFSVRRIMNSFNMNAHDYIYLEVDYKSIFDAFESQTLDSIGLLVYEKDTKEVFYDNKKYDIAPSTLLENSLQTEINNSGTEYIIVDSFMQNEKWQVIGYFPKELLLEESKSIILATVLVVGISLILILLMTFIYSYWFVRRINKLKRKINQVVGGNLNVSVSTDINDEIGQLTNDFGLLMDKLRELIDDNVKKTIEQRGTEIKLQQAKINHHFLYNTLSLINWKAKFSGQDDISDLAVYLSKYYRLTLNKGKSFVSLKNEVEHVMYYIKIQQIVHENKFDVEYGIDDTVLDAQVMHIILQPIVENAIEHGVLNNEQARGNIKISAQAYDEILQLTVTDNGIGIDSEVLDKLLIEGDYGYGLSNVNERIKLQYGNEYGVSIDSEIGKGTIVKITLPIKI